MDTPTPAEHDFGRPAERRIAVRVTPDAQRHLRAGHPWVFDRSITSVSHDGAPGDLAVVFDRQRRFMAIGLWDPRSPIRVRVLHHGAPTPIDEAFWEARVAAAVEHRRSLLADGATTGYRLVHGENDGFGGLVADVYDDTLVVKVYSEAWFPHLRSLLPPLLAAGAASRAVLRLGRLVARHAPDGVTDGTTLHGTPPSAPITFLEHGLAFGADVVTGNKTGHFLDQRHNRHAVAGFADGARVLDVFSSNGGFSVHALAGGARSALAIDASSGALSAATANVNRNRSRIDGSFSTRHGDAFDVLADLGRSRALFDVVVVDPPSFAARAGAVPAAVAAYGRLTRLAAAVVAPDGHLVQASCSSRVSSDELVGAVVGQLGTERRPFEIAGVTGHDVDHPVRFPEGAYLKAVFVRLG